MNRRHLTKRALEFIGALLAVTFLLIVATDDNGQPPVLGAVLAWLIIGVVVAVFAWLAVGELRARRARRRWERRQFARDMDAVRHVVEYAPVDFEETRP